MEFEVKKFDDLSIYQLHDIYQLRAEVFVVEQDCVYQDIDGKDQKALHILGVKDKKLITYARIFKPGDYFKEASFGRVVVAASQRKYGYGHQLVKATNLAIATHLNEQRIHISAQTYLQKFYEAHGFKVFGKEFLEDGIPHIGMIKSE
jgi:ElaA protein